MEVLGEFFLKIPIKPGGEATEIFGLNKNRRNLPRKINKKYLPSEILARPLIKWAFRSSW